MADYFEKPFAETGLKTAIPVNTTIDGSVSYEQGWGTDYEIDPVADPVNAKYPELRNFNQLFYKVTNNIKEWQEQTFPDWIADKGDGSPYLYNKYVIVTYTDGLPYVSLVASNDGEPTIDTDKWQLLEEFIKGFILGWGQTWQALEASRTAGVTYTNTTGKPISLIVTTDSSVDPSLEIFVDGLKVYYTALNGFSKLSTSSIIVPKDSTYRAVVVNSSIAEWRELR